MTDAPPARGEGLGVGFYNAQPLPLAPSPRAERGNEANENANDLS